jgi:hypothetical protein
MTRRYFIVRLLVAIGWLPVTSTSELRKETTGGQLRIQTQNHIPNFPSRIDLRTINHPDNNRDWIKMRRHGWRLFLNLTTEASILRRRPLKAPLWESWYAKCDLDLSPNCDQPVGGHDTFVGTSPQIPKHPDDRFRQFSTVYYSPSAGNWILKFGLQNGSDLQSILSKQLNDSTPSGRAVPSFPHDSIVVKEIWEGFTVAPGLPQLDEVRVYDPGDFSYDDGTHNGLIPIVRWPSIMTIFNKNGIPDETAPCKPGNYEKSDPVPISCFYNLKFSSTCAAVMEKKVALVGEVPQRTATCYLVLVGVHIATKEIPNWTWSTFWWTNKPSLMRQADPADIQRKIPPQYSHYVMDTTFGAPLNTTRGRYVFNPYLEGPTIGGANTNCFGCHQRAVYDPRGAVDGTTFVQHTSGQGIKGPGVEVDGKTRDPLTTPFPCIFKQVSGSCPLHTGFLWSLATNQDPLTASPI